MISKIKGIVTEKDINNIEVETKGGFAFELFCTEATISKLNIGDNVELKTYLQVKEDGLLLFGFGSKEEKGMFEKLITISGIGPKMAVSILSGTTPADLALAILSQNISVLSKIKGVGKKTAERIVLELKEKVAKEDSNGAVDKQEQTGKKLSKEMEDAVFALKALGIRQYEAEKEVLAVADANMKAEDIIKICLRGMAK